MADDRVKGTSAAPGGAGKDVATVSAPGTRAPARSGHVGAPRHLQELIRTIRDGDDATLEAAVVRLSHTRRILAPLALAVGALAMLFEGLRLLVTNWRLTLVQILPAMWIWAAVRYRDLIANPKSKAKPPAAPGQRGHPPSIERPRAARPWRTAHLG